MRYVTSVIISLFCAVGAMAPAQAGPRLVSEEPQDLPLPSECSEDCRSDRRVCLERCVASVAPGERQRNDLSDCAVPCEERSDRCDSICP